MESNSLIGQQSSLRNRCVQASRSLLLVVLAARVQAVVVHHGIEHQRVGTCVSPRHTGLILFDRKKNKANGRRNRERFAGRREFSRRGVDPEFHNRIGVLIFRE